MRCSVAQGQSRDRCVFASVFMLGTLFVISASPAARVPLISALVLVGVPLMTFSVAAPSRIGVFAELGLLFRDLEALLLQGLCMLVGRRDVFARIRRRHQDRVSHTYAQTGGALGEAVAQDPLRLMHARRLSLFAAIVGVFSGMTLPLAFPAVYTFGSWPEAPFVFGLDALVFSTVSFVVCERVVLRLFEATHVLRGGADKARFRAFPLMAILGGALGAVGALVIVTFGAMACAVETSWMEPSLQSLAAPAFWFLRFTAPNALPLGIAAGVVLGAGMGLGQRKYLPAPRDV